MSLRSIVRSSPDLTHPALDTTPHLNPLAGPRRRLRNPYLLFGGAGLKERGSTSDTRLVLCEVHVLYCDVLCGGIGDGVGVMRRDGS